MDYTKLPDDIVEKIASHHLHTFSQLLAFSHVCKSWRSAALNRRHLLCLPGLLVLTTKATAADASGFRSASSRIWRPPHEFLPLTMLSHRNDQQQSESEGRRRRRRRLPSVTLPQFVTRSSHMSRYDGAVIQKQYYVASKDGWLLLVIPASTFPTMISFSLLNPITESSFHLPPLPFNVHVRKAIISSSPDDDDCHVFILFDSTPRLAWCNVHSKDGWKFTARDDDDQLTFNSPLEVDMDYFGGKLHVVDGEHVHVVDGLITCTPTVRVFPLSSAMSRQQLAEARSSSMFYMDGGNYRCHYHLADFQGQLLVILHHRTGYRHAKSESKHEFEVCKLVPGPGGGENNNTVNYYWSKVTNLDGYAVFVGSHQSFCLPADPLLNNRVKGNCIYFAFGGDYIFSDDFGVFNLVDQTVERFATDSN